MSVAGDSLSPTFGNRNSRRHKGWFSLIGLLANDNEQVDIVTSVYDTMRSVQKLVRNVRSVAQFLVYGFSSREWTSGSLARWPLTIGPLPTPPVVASLHLPYYKGIGSLCANNIGNVELRSRDSNALLMS